MNTKHRWETTCTIYDPERARFWLSALGCNTVPVTSVRAARAELPGLGAQDVYMLDLAALWPEQIEKVVKGLAVRFGLTADQVLQDLGRGVPILAQGCYVTGPETAEGWRFVEDNPEIDLPERDYEAGESETGW
ncbi:MAG: hypothetical protein ACOYYJ_17265 [Chloroflexota bacterium]